MRSNFLKRMINKGRWKLSISTKLILLLLLFGLLPLGAVSFIAWEAGEALNEKIGKKFEVVAGNISNKIDRSLFERYGDVQAFVLNSNILRRIHWYDTSQDNIIQNLMNTLVQQYAIYDLMIIVDLDGKVIAVNDEDHEGNQLNTQFIYDQEYSDATWFQRLHNQDYSTSQPYSAPENTRRTGTVVEDVHVDQDVKRAYPNSDGLTLGFSAPIYEDGKVVAFWTNRTSFSLVEEIIVQGYQELQNGGFSDAEITLLDGEGTILVDYDPMKYGTQSIIHDFETVLFKVNLVEAGVAIAQEAVNGGSGFLEARHARKNIFQHGGYTHLRGFRGFSGMNWVVLVRVPSVQVTAERDGILNQIWLMAFIVLGILLTLGIFIGRRATGRIRVLELVAQEMANGNFSSRIPKLQHDELGSLGIALNELGEKSQEVVAKAHAIAEGNFGVEISIRSEQDTFSLALKGMIDSLREVRDMAQRVSRGDFSQRIQEKSENDFLGQAMNHMVEHFQSLALQMDRVAEGDFSAEIRPRSQEDILGQALSRMVAQIRERTEADQQETWLKSGVSQLAECIQGESDIQIVSSRVISELAKLLNAGYGVLYVREQDDHHLYSTEEKQFSLMGAYAYRPHTPIVSQVKEGEGLIGQCVVEKDSILLSPIPSDYVPIQSGVGEQVPKQVLVTPVLYESEVVGVIELATFQEFTDIQRELLSKVTSNFGITLNSLFARQKTEQYLEESQSLTLELQVQHEELQATNDELTAKAQALQESEEILKQQSEELKLSNEEIQFAQRDLEKKAQDLAQASQYKSEFLANMSHELRTPLNSLLILAKTLTENEEGNLTDEQIESARVIHSGGKDLLHLINDILDLSKVEAGKLNLNVESVSIDEVCGRLHSLIAPLAIEKGNTWAIDRAPDIPSRLITDQQRLEQIIKNLLSNAVKFTSKGSVTLRIHRMEVGIMLPHTSLQADSTIVFSVVDTGLGISEEKQADIFEAFQQADGSTSRTYGGTGLGLTISRELAGMLGGKIQMESEVGKGSIFSLYLPYEYRKVVCAHPFIPKETLEQANRVSHQTHQEPEPHRVELEGGQCLDPLSKTSDPTHILIIEDDAVFGRIIQRYATKQGYTCSLAQTGLEGLQLATTLEPSAIILDMTLPDLSGDELLESLKQNAVTRQIPVHVISSRDNLGATLTKGAVAYLTKPVDIEILRETIKSISQRQKKSPMNVLLVEDDPLTQQTTCQMFERQGGIEVVVMGTAQAAADHLRDCQCDLLIVDLRLPDRSGLELLQAFSREDDQDLPPVIVYTGKDLSHDEHQALLEYAICVVLKGGLASSERLLEEIYGVFQTITSSLPKEPPVAAVADSLDPDSVSLLYGQTVMIVDDEVRNVFTLSKILKQVGAEVIIADTGALALEQLETATRVDFVLLDILMPEMDGYETTRRIRQHPRYAGIPIFMLSAKTASDEEARSLEVGANGFLRKPLDLEQLYGLMTECMTHHQENPT